MTRSLGKWVKPMPGMPYLVLGRPYALFDTRINLGIPARLEQMGFDLVNQTYLILQLDEQSSDVGYMTRIEAAADTFVNDFKIRKTQITPIEIRRRNYGPDILHPGDTVLIPMTDRRVNRFQQALFEVAGFDAHVIALDREMLNLGYRYASGGECLPNVAVAGSLIATLEKKEIDPEKALVYLPNLSLSCNFNQYANLIKLACEKAGFSRVRVMNVNGLEAIPRIPARSNAQLLSATILSSILNKLQYRFQPYETTPGATLTAVGQAEAVILRHILDKKSLLNGVTQVRAIFEGLPCPEI